MPLVTELEKKYKTKRTALTFVWKYKDSQMIKAAFSKKNKAEGLEMKLSLHLQVQLVGGCDKKFRNSKSSLAT